MQNIAHFLKQRDKTVTIKYLEGVGLWGKDIRLSRGLTDVDMNELAALINEKAGVDAARRATADQVRAQVGSVQAEYQVLNQDNNSIDIDSEAKSVPSQSAIETAIMADDKQTDQGSIHSDDLSMHIRKDNIPSFSPSDIQDSSLPSPGSTIPLSSTGLQGSVDSLGGPPLPPAPKQRKRGWKLGRAARRSHTGPSLSTTASRHGHPRRFRKGGDSQGIKTAEYMQDGFLLDKPVDWNFPKPKDRKNPNKREQRELENARRLREDQDIV
jgi:hypothetical protein